MDFMLYRCLRIVTVFLSWPYQTRLFGSFCHLMLSIIGYWTFYCSQLDTSYVISGYVLTKRSYHFIYTRNAKQSTTIGYRYMHWRSLYPIFRIQLLIIDNELHSFSFLCCLHQMPRRQIQTSLALLTFLFAIYCQPPPPLLCYLWLGRYVLIWYLAPLQ